MDPELLLRGYRSVAIESKRGLIAYPFIFFVVGWSSSIGDRTSFWLVFALAVVLTSIRAVFVVRFEKLYQADPLRWRLVTAVTLLLTVLSFSSLGFLEILVWN
jgi:predicted PurR-regulated permease PerM